MSVYELDKTFDKINFKETPLPKGDYEFCSFNNCDFSEADLFSVSFTECQFVNCNFSLTKFGRTSFRDVKFNDCKLMGLHFENCNPFGLSFCFEDCQILHSSFYQQNIAKTLFKNCRIIETDFTETNLSYVVFDNSDLSGSVFSGSILERTDFRTAKYFSVDLSKNKVKKAKFSAHNLVGLLDNYDLEIDS
ncbi:pentapeptide repeat-containing protein [Elizabethkingia anophelis]|uniref:Pentapeptide repeat-containing protein n=1 Tax=Elizabethkingia anophelis TaxID=1117645 RepID=A0AAU8VBU7_9FLAO|nr:pentapeptide repeat-containing protein [Elizabethkingia anophelis]AQX00390.1 hypothetical protein BBD32_02385 [Elizabethkingia anophelis]KGT09500.1 pentapeptide repeat-containing protein [Elizabethkingia anophelis]MCT3735896.1 pentapeptide repeat-containing protein [Elizabethkingia anophelis]MCT3760624.1 pentapeptide repeat-containing protein [Elizabethkingia anophelis]MCT3971770.1 pentapeptide repeat-containing protein [Elizabethkingia anophelis]